MGKLLGSKGKEVKPVLEKSIGKTRSGKKVKGNTQIGDESFSDFTAQDFSDAAGFHFAASHNTTSKGLTEYHEQMGKDLLLKASDKAKEQVEGTPYKKYPSLGLFLHNDPNRVFGGIPVGGYTITEKESGFQIVSGKTIKEAKDKLDELVDEYGGEDAFKKMMEELISKRRKNQKLK